MSILSILGLLNFKGACSDPQPVFMETLVSELESYLEGALCVTFHAQAQCSSIEMCEKQLFRKLENMVSTF